MNTANKTNYRFGFDVRTNSLGWSVFELNEDNEIVKLKSAGSRIFTDGRSVRSRATTLKSERQKARSARRMRDRFIQRQQYLLSYLTEIGLFPADKAQRLMLQKEDPIKLRADALTTQLKPHQIGRALFHLNQRRGFKSNRKDSGQDIKDGTVSKSVNKLLIEMGLMTAPTAANSDANLNARVDKKKFSKEEKATVKAKRERQYAERRGAEDKLAEQSELSFGAFLYELHKEGKPIRARRDAQSKLYDFYPTRGLLEDEFNKICAAQSKYYPELFNDEIIEKIKKIIFTQRPLKAAKIGLCTFIKGEKRAYRAMPSMQQYRIYQEVNNLKWNDSEGEVHCLRNYPQARDAIIACLETNKKVTFKAMKNMLKKMSITEFNYEIESRDGFDGNLTSCLMQDENRIGAQWHDWSLEKQNQFIKTLLGYEDVEVKGKKETRSKDDARVLAELKSKYALSDMSAESCLEAEMFLPSGTARLSETAANLLIPKMRDDYLQLYDAVAAVAKESDGNFNNPHITEKKNLDEQLSYYGKIFQDGGHIIPGTGEEEDKNDEHKFYGGVSNPTVHIALNQIRRVVNELIRRYGLPSSMSIELDRDLPAGETMIKALNKEQSATKNCNDRYDKILIEQGQLQNRENRLLLRLWEESGAPLDRCCLYSGDLITLTDLFNKEATEVDHILPFSDSLDDSYANKILVTKKSTQDKRKKTPFEAFGNNPTGYNWGDINKRIANLPESKRWRFQKNAKEILETEKKDFTERHLNDTRYIGRLAREYLSRICPSEKIDVVTGRLTSLLRREWDLNKILSDDDAVKKNRDDHRHHAVDAIVVGATTKSMIQWVSKTAQEMDNHPGLDSRQIFRAADGKSRIDPWLGFRKDVKMIVDNIVVSHKPTQKKSGQLHNETALGIVDKEYFLAMEKKQNGQTPIETKVVGRKPTEIACQGLIEKYNKLAQKYKKSGCKESVKDSLEYIQFRSLQNKLLSIYDETKSIDDVISYAKSKGIRALRCISNISIIPIKEKEKDLYKGYKGDGNWVVEIYEMPKPTPNSHDTYEAGEWKGTVISRFDANTKTYQERESYKPHSAAKLVMRLHINDCIEIEENGKKRIIRLQKISRGVLTFADHHEANVDKRNRNGQDSFKFMQKVVPVLKKLKARQVYISPTGLISYKK